MHLGSLNATQLQGASGGPMAATILIARPKQMRWIAMVQLIAAVCNAMVRRNALQILNALGLAAIVNLICVQIYLGKRIAMLIRDVPGLEELARSILDGIARGSTK